MGRTPATIGLVAILALAAAGCGSGQSQTSESSPSPPSGSPGQGQTTPHHYEGGEKSIEDFGAEAAGSTRGAILGTFRGYLRAVGRRDYATACTYLARRVKRSLERLARKGALGCAMATLAPMIAPREPTCRAVNL